VLPLTVFALMAGTLFGRGQSSPSMRAGAASAHAKVVDLIQQASAERPIKTVNLSWQCRPLIPRSGRLGIHSQPDFECWKCPVYVSEDAVTPGF